LWKAILRLRFLHPLVIRKRSEDSNSVNTFLANGFVDTVLSNLEESGDKAANDALLVLA
jgi:hypothetical protein